MRKAVIVSLNAGGAFHVKSMVLWVLCTTVGFSGAAGGWGVKNQVLTVLSIEHEIMPDALLMNATCHFKPTMLYAVVRVCVRARARVCVRARVCECARAPVRVHTYLRV